MFNLQRNEENPILSPDPNSIWESEAAFNGSVVRLWFTTHMVYRAISSRITWHGEDLNVSTIGYANSYDSIHFGNRRQLIYPEKDWEEFGCEDPRVTRLNGKFYIFYTALSGYPFNSDNIKVAVATTRDFKTIDSKKLVTPFNAKAMALFPGHVGGKMAAVLSVDTDKPPAKICLAFFDNEDQIWSADYWKKWQENIHEHTLPLLRSSADQVEVGAAPIKTNSGWLLVYSYIKNYKDGSGEREFGVEAVLLDLQDPTKIIGRTPASMIKPRDDYETKGLVPDIVFPSGALIKGNELFVYYGGADKVVAVAHGDLNRLLKYYMLPWGSAANWVKDFDYRKGEVKLERSSANPILEPRPEVSWEAKAVFNPAVVSLGNKIHLLYRAMAEDSTSYVGYASTTDGVKIDQRLKQPVFVAGAEASGQRVRISAEDPRISRIDDTLYMCYTAYDGRLPRVSLTSIKVQDFLNQNWNWTLPVLISPEGMDDKDACLLPGKIKGKYAVFHRLNNRICLDYVSNLKFKKGTELKGNVIMDIRPDKWDNVKIGIAGPPIDVGNAWLLLYHGVSQPGNVYKVGCALLDHKDPQKVLARMDYPIFEPKARYELDQGQVHNVVFPCGAAVKGDRLLVYYGGCDQVIGVASVDLKELIKETRKYPV